MEGWQWARKQMVKFWWRSGSPSGYRIDFRIRHYWEIRKVVNGWFIHTISPDGSTGKTCLCGGMQCPSASSYLYYRNKYLYSQTRQSWTSNFAAVRNWLPLYTTTKSNSDCVTVSGEYVGNFN